MLAHLSPIVAVPARNEAQRLPHLLRALNGQQSWTDGHPVLPVVIVLNNTTDDSAAIVRSMVASLSRISIHMVERSFAPEAAHVGSARRLAMETAAGIIGNNSAILTTDADAIPAEDWVAQNLLAIANGADIVGGRIVGDPEEETHLGPGFKRRAAKYAQYANLCDELASVIDPISHDPWPRHQDHTGGSMAVRGDVYTAVGGMPALPFREDIGFVSTVLRAGYRLVHPMAVTVTVSARTEGRAPGGMADCVKSWVADELAGKPILVESPHAVEDRLWIRHAARHQQCTDPLKIAKLLDEQATTALDVIGTVPIDRAILQISQRLLELKGVRHAV